MTQRKHVPLHLKRRPSLLPLSTASLRSPSSFRKLNSAADLTVAADLRDVISRYIARVYQFPIFLLSLSPLLSNDSRGNSDPSERASSLVNFFFFHYETDHRLTDFRGKRPPLFQEFERYNSSSPTWRPSRCLARVHAHTHTRTHVDVARARHVETRHRSLSNDRTAAREGKTRRTRKRRGRERGFRGLANRTNLTHALSLSLPLSLYLSLCVLSSVFKPVLEPRDFIAGLFVPIARTTGRSYSKFSARIGGACERARRVYNGWRETGDITRALLTHQGTHVRQGRQGYTHCSLTAANPLTRGLKSSSFLSASPLARCQCQLIVAGEEEPVARFYALPR